MDTIRLKPERKAQLEEYAQRHGQDAAAALDDVLASALEWERQDYEEAVKGIRAGCADFQGGRTQPANEVLDRATRETWDSALKRLLGPDAISTLF